MRRTTICRSSRAALLVLAAVPLLWRLLPAQDTTQAAPAAMAQVPASHTVARGETLWSIAQMYFADPLLWPEIYRLNTNVVEDPHWIYPGEVLVLGPVAGVVAQGGDTVVAVPQDTSGYDTGGVRGAAASRARGRVVRNDVRSSPHHPTARARRAAGVYPSAVPAAACGRVLRRRFPHRE